MAASQDGFDVFLSYTRQDVAAENVRTRLAEAGLHAFLDRYALPAGQPSANTTSWSRRLIKSSPAPTKSALARSWDKSANALSISPSVLGRHDVDLQPERPSRPIQAIHEAGPAAHAGAGAIIEGCTGGGLFGVELRPVSD